jgi:hypothetical protein
MTRAPTVTTPPPRPRTESEVIDRLQALETRVLVYEERINQRLSAGAATIGEMKATLGDLTPKRQALIPWVAVAIALGGILFRAGNYPNRDELGKANERVIEQVEGLRGEVRSLERELVKLRTEVETQSARLAENIRRGEERSRSQQRRSK